MKTSPAWCCCEDVDGAELTIAKEHARSSAAAWSGPLVLGGGGRGKRGREGASLTLVDGGHEPVEAKRRETGVGRSAREVIQSPLAGALYSTLLARCRNWTGERDNTVSS